ncbi:MAG: aminotransferase class III-fold pyridoxal phosphate-dependent enzyme, partial [Bacteroidia bacterium]|nr:aminotransferase class III-fold pyridoxal phosphate-dependent enzyme [Bacteroidia bacterium]
AIAVLDVIESESLVRNAFEVGSYLIENLLKIQRENPGRIAGIRGKGLMIGIEMESGFEDVRNRLLFEDHIFTGAAKTNIIRLLPPLSITKEDADLFLKCFIHQLSK